jgi:hypothetical protein
MPALAQLIDPDTAAKLARIREQAAEREQVAAATPVQPMCRTCGQRLPVPGAVFSDGTDR